MLYLIPLLFDIYPSFLDVLRVILVFFTVLIIFSILNMITYFEYKHDEGKTSYYRDLKNMYFSSEKMTKNLLKVILVVGTILLILPSERGLATFGAIYINNQLNENVNNPEFNREAYQVLNDTLNSYLEEIKLKSNK